MGSACSNNSKISQPSKLKTAIKLQEEIDEQQEKQDLIKQQQQYEVGEYFSKNVNQYDDQQQVENKLDFWRKKIKEYDQLQKSKAQIVDQLLNEKTKFYINGYAEKNLAIFNNQNGKLFQQLIKAKPPSSYRWTSWKILVYDQKITCKDLYQKLLQVENSKEEVQIQKDVGRTFPEHPFFNQNKENFSPGQDQLFRVLKAIANYFPLLGYTQGINFWIGFCLLVNGGNELDAFWFFVTLAQKKQFLVMGLFEDNFPLVKLMVHLFKEKFQQKFPQLYQHFSELDVPDPMWVWNWIITWFIYQFPMSFVTRLWDYILTENIFSVLSLSLAFLDYNNAQFMKYDLSEFQDYLKSLKQLGHKILDKNNKQHIDVEKIIKLAEKYKYSDKEVENYVQKFKSGFEPSANNPQFASPQEREDFRQSESNMYVEYYSKFHSDPANAERKLNLEILKKRVEYHDQITGEELQQNINKLTQENIRSEELNEKNRSQKQQVQNIQITDPKLQQFLTKQFQETETIQIKQSISSPTSIKAV